MKIVIDLGGSMIAPREGIDKERILKYAEAFKEIYEMGHSLAIVVGGGKVAREYIEIARELGSNNGYCDMLGIMATRMNAMLLISALKELSIKKVPKSFEEAEEILSMNKIPVMGGTHPGHTTDAVSAGLAEYIDANLLIIATNVDGIYDKDPKKYKDAKKYDRIKIEELINIINTQSLEAGSSSVVDLLAAKIIERAKLKAIVVKGEPENILKAVKGERIGTIIE
ncbi:UMP kinase [Methanocaldococcus infernus]